MRKDERDLLEVLKFELNFLEKGGYGRSPREPWKPSFIFEDSPTCMNYDCKENPNPCSDCVLMQLVAPELRSEAIPCRHIPLNAAGETLDSLYRYGDQLEVEEKVANWLRATVSRLEQERELRRLGEIQQPPNESTVLKGAPLYQNLHHKCANPACPTAFHWLAGGKFFRFRSEQSDVTIESPASDSTKNPHGVKHFWLCEPCSHAYTLQYDAEMGVVLRLLHPELPSPERATVSKAA